MGKKMCKMAVGVGADGDGYFGEGDCALLWFVPSVRGFSLWTRCPSGKTVNWAKAERLKTVKLAKK
jgi:hypothetical protein